MTSFVPSMLSVFAATVPDPGLLRTLRAVAVAGEALPAATVASFRAVSRAAVHNLYGPTEFTVHATAALVPPLPYLASRPVPMRTSDERGARRVASTVTQRPSTNTSATAWKSIGWRPGA